MNTSLRKSMRVWLIAALVAVSMPVYGSPELAFGVATDVGNITSDLRCVTFVNATTGYAAGASGVIIKTTDAGATWRFSRSGGTGDDYDLRSISFVDENNGWAISLTGRVFRTTNGGATWDPVSGDLGTISYGGERIYDAHFINASTGFAVGGANLTQPAVWTTYNYGFGDWSNPATLLGSYYPAGTTPGDYTYPLDGLGYFYGLDFVPGSTTLAWAVGQDVLYSPYKSVVWSYDASRVGVKWIRQTTATGTGKLFDVSFSSATKGVAVGELGQVRYTANAGATWSIATSGVTGDIAAVDLEVGGSRGMAVGASGKIIRTLNSGATWTVLPAYTGRYLEDVAWVGGDTVIAVGRGGELIRSTNAGASWSRPSAPAPPPAPVMTALTSSSHPVDVWTASTSVNAAWSATGTNITGYGYVLDTSPSTIPTVQNTTATSLATSVGGSGTYYLHVAAKDIYGQWSSPLHRQLLVDVSAPSVSDDVLPGYVESARVTISASDPQSGVDRIEYRVDGGSVETSYSGQASVDFTVGDFVLSYRAVDDLGNASGWTDVDVSVAPPAAPVMTSLTSSSHPLGSWAATTSVAAAWTASGTDLAGYGWVLDGSSGTVPGTLNTTGTSLNTAVGGSGTYYLHVAAVDDYVQWSAPLHRQLLVDVTAPSVSDDAEAGYTGAARVTITASDAHSGVSRIEYRIDGGSVETSYAAQASVDFAVGESTLSYRAVDSVGNASGWTEVDVVVDPPGPPVMTSLTSSSHPLGTWVAATSIAAAWTAIGADLAGYGWVLDASANTGVSVQNTAASTLATTVAGSGTYYLHVAAVDDYAQWSSTWHRQVLVDVTVPTIVDDAAPAYVYSALLTLTASDAHSGVDRIEYRVNGGGVQTVSASQAEVYLGVGDHTLEYRAVDNAGNASFWSSLDVEVAPPAPPTMTSLTSSSHPLASWTATTSVAAAWTASGTDLAGYGWVLDSSAGTVPSTQNTVASSLSTTTPGSGTYYLHVAAIDDYGQWSTPWHRQLLVDVTVPTVDDDVAGGYVYAATVTLTASDAHSGVDRIEYRIDEGSLETSSAGQAVLDFAVGNYSLSYRAVDHAGNASGWTNVDVDVAPPAPPVMMSVTSSTHPDGQWVASKSVSAAWTAAGVDITGYGYVLDTSAVTSVTVANAGLSTSMTGAVVSSSGTYYLHVAARDANQWSTPWHQQILVDVDRPSATDNALTSRYGGLAEVRITANDVHSGVARIEYTLDGGATQSVVDSQILLEFAAGEHALSYRAVDYAGNASAWANRTIIVDPIITSVAGDDRYATALEACAIAFPGEMSAGPDGHKTVIIASGANWPDALAAAGLAGAHEGPLLLTPPTGLPTAVAQRITSLGADRAIVVGGTAAVPAAVLDQVAARVGGAANVKRYAGDTRYLTSNMIAAETVKVTGRPAWDGSAFVSTGGNFPDALAAGPLAAANGWPLYLANPGAISPTTINAMKAAGVERVYLLGGTAAVSEASRAAIVAAGITVAERWDGADRYATGVRVANESLERGLTAARPALATGLKFPDALAGGVMQGLDGSILLLTRTDSLPADVTTFITSNKGVIEEVRFLGGTAAISDAVRAEVTGMITP